MKTGGVGLRAKLGDVRCGRFARRRFYVECQSMGEYVGSRCGLTVLCSAKPVPLSYTSRSSSRPLLRSAHSNIFPLQIPSSVDSTSCSSSYISSLLQGCTSGIPPRVVLLVPTSSDQDNGRASEEQSNVCGKTKVVNYEILSRGGVKTTNFCWSCFIDAS